MSKEPDSGIKFIVEYFTVKVILEEGAEGSWSLAFTDFMKTV